MNSFDHRSKHTARTWKRFCLILRDSPKIDLREYMAPIEEFQARVRRTNPGITATSTQPHRWSRVFFRRAVCWRRSRYLGGNTNVSIEQVAGVIGPNGPISRRGGPGGRLVLPNNGPGRPCRSDGCTRSNCCSWPTMKYPGLSRAAQRMSSKPQQARMSTTLLLLTPRQVIPAGLVEYLQNIYGKEGVVDAQALYYRVKYEKSAIEMRLIADALRHRGCDVMRAMCWRCYVPGVSKPKSRPGERGSARMLASERYGFFVNRRWCHHCTPHTGSVWGTGTDQLGRGDWVPLGVAPKRDGLTACIRSLRNCRGLADESYAGAEVLVRSCRGRIQGRRALVS